MLKTKSFITSEFRPYYIFKKNSSNNKQNIKMLIRKIKYNQSTSVFASIKDHSTSETQVKFNVNCPFYVLNN